MTETTDEGAGYLPLGWERVPLQAACIIIQGQSPPGDTYNTSGEGLPFFQGKAEFGPLSPTPRKWCASPAKIAEPNDTLISIPAPRGATNLCPTRSCIGRGLAAIRPQGGIEPRYLLYGLRATVDSLVEQGTGSTFDAISGDVLREHELPLAPLPEQRRIVARIEELLSQVDAGVAGLRDLQKKLKRYRAAVLKAACEGTLVPTEAELARAEGRPYEPADDLLARVLAERRARWEADQLAKMRAKGAEPKDDRWKAKYEEPAAPDTSDLPELPDGWSMASLEALTTVVSGFAFSSNDFASDGVAAIKIANVGYGTFENKGQEYLPATFTESHSDYIVRPSTLLLALTRPITNDAVKACLYPENAPTALLNQRVAMIVTEVPVLRSFVLVFLRSQKFKDFIRANVNETLQPNLSPLALRKMLLPHPPFAEQERIVAEVERRLSVLDQMEAALRDNLKRADRLRQAVLRDAFAGKLVPQDPADEPAAFLLERIRAERAEAGTGRAPRDGNGKTPRGAGRGNSGGRKAKVVPQEALPLLAEAALAEVGGERERVRPKA